MSRIKFVFQICAIVLLTINTQLLNAQIDTSYSLEYMTDTLVLGAHPLTSQFKLKHNSVYISRKSKELAATFDDPSRVLKRHVGISTSNDQANGIIYHGLPSDFTKWTIHGAEIVNPNHTSNAGTFSDISSQSAGGVLGIPFDVINTFSFHANTHTENTPTTLAGVANFNFLSESERFLKLGLLGLEFGNQTKETKIPTKSHFRYSTVGLLGQLGVDFGGEKIAFMDGFFQAELSPNLNFITGGGLSSNSFEGIENPDEAIEQKELTNIDFLSYFYYGGFVFDKKRHKHSFIYSQKRDERKAESDFINVFSQAELLIFKTAYAGQIPIFKEDIEMFDVLINASVSSEDHRFPMSVTNTSLRGFLDLGLRYGWYNDKYSMKAKIGPKVDFVNFEITPEVSFIASRQFNASSIELGSSISTQEQTLEIFGFNDNFRRKNDELLRNKSFNTSISYKAEFIKNQKILVRLFYHHLYDLPADSLGYSPIFNAPYDIGDGTKQLLNRGVATNYGLELMYDQKFDNGFYMNTNLTFFDFTNDGYNATNNFKYLANLILSKSWSMQKERSLSANIAYHLRGGAYDYFQITNPRRLNPYSRVDLRIQYEVKKSTFALDVQNVTNRKNDGFYYFDQLQQMLLQQKQLGLIPVFSWKRLLK